MPSPASKSSVAPACVCGRLRRAARALTQLYDDTMAPSGLRITQFSLLSTLARNGPQRISELAAEGLVRIAAGRDDARTREVALTRAGEAALARATPYWRRAQVLVARQMGQQNIDALVGLLNTVEELHPAPADRGA